MTTNKLRIVELTQRDLGIGTFGKIIVSTIESIDDDQNSLKEILYLISKLNFIK